MFTLNIVFCIMADMVPRGGGGDGGSTVIKLDTVRRIAEKVSRSSITQTIFSDLFCLRSCSTTHTLFSFPRTSTRSWTSLPLRWKGWTTSSTTRWSCSWTLTAARKLRPWGRGTAQTPTRAPGAFTHRPSSWGNTAATFSQVMTHEQSLSLSHIIIWNIMDYIKVCR